MANNFKLFDENKGNMLTDSEYASSAQRLGGVQTGVASSSLENKFAYQVSLIAYAIASVMEANGIDANDSMAVSAFVNNLSATFLQKVNDKASEAQAQAGADDATWMSPSKCAALIAALKATAAEAQAGAVDNHWLSPAGAQSFLTAKKATVAQAQGGTVDTTWMSPAKTQSFLTAKKASTAEAKAGSLDTKWVSPLGLNNAMKYLGTQLIGSTTITSWSQTAQLARITAPFSFIPTILCLEVEFTSFPTAPASNLFYMGFAIDFGTSSYLPVLSPSLGYEQQYLNKKNRYFIFCYNSSSSYNINITAYSWNGLRMIGNCNLSNNTIEVGIYYKLANSITAGTASAIVNVYGL